jgi:hypothetical protein
MKEPIRREIYARPIETLSIIRLAANQLVTFCLCEPAANPRQVITFSAALLHVYRVFEPICYTYSIYDCNSNPTIPIIVSMIIIKPLF